MNQNVIKITVVVALLVGAYAYGRRSAPEKTHTVTIQVDKIVEVVKHTVTTIREKPDGTKETIIIADENAKENSKAKSIDDSKISNRHSIVSIALLGLSKKVGTAYPIGGISISKEIVGPITLGVFGFQDKTFGLSIGINL